MVCCYLVVQKINSMIIALICIGSNWILVFRNDCMFPYIMEKVGQMHGSGKLTFPYLCP